MKNTTIPPLRVSQELRKQAEALLQEGETLSSFVLEALSRNIEYRKARQEFLDRGLASAARSRRTGKYVSADAVISKLGRRLARARRRAAWLGAPLQGSVHTGGGTGLVASLRLPA